MISINVQGSTDKIVAELKGTPKLIMKAQVQALNRTGDRVRTQVTREVKSSYAVKAGAVRAATKIRKASVGGNRRVEVWILGKRIELIHFNPSAVNPWNISGRAHKRRGGGVRIRIKKGGGKKLIEGAFLATAKSGHELVLLRVPSSDPRAQGRKRSSPPGRYPVINLTTLSLAHMSGTKLVSRKIITFADMRYSIEFQAALRNQLARANR